MVYIAGIYTMSRKTWYLIKIYFKLVCMNDLKITLKNLLDENNMSVSEAERLSGLKMSALRNILRGTSKNPSAEILLKLANLFQCNIDDLLSNNVKNILTNRTEPIEKFDVLVSIAEFIKNTAQQNDIIISWSQFTKIQQDSYEYCVNNDLSELDINFIKWLFSKEGIVISGTKYK